MVFQHLSGFTALRSAPRQNFWPRGAPRIFAQNGTSRAWRPRAERRSGAGSIGAAVRCRRLPGGEKSGRLPAPRSVLALNRRRTLYIREAKSPRPSPIHTPTTHKQRTADRGRAGPGAPAHCSTRAGSQRRHSVRAPPRQNSTPPTLPTKSTFTTAGTAPPRIHAAAFQCVHYSAAPMLAIRRRLSAGRNQRPAIRLQCSSA